MEEYRPAELTLEALAAIRRLEEQLGVTLVAYERRPVPEPEPRHS